MPNSIIKKVSDVLDKPVDEIEKLWDKAKEMAKNDYDSANNYEIIMGIFKHSLGKEANMKLGWDTNWSPQNEELLLQRSSGVFF
ncbi:MAG: hypothetical protein PHC28_16290 [Flavobacterium sp.]|uniref:hypothetical protein n=1 Tax=Flavobacterium sp. TaxID=239 RepID=UPI0026169C11|nr:hypothetical protein [Flavobacterium sp.]MDD5152013.1 hypothetical protein [Flavobacterium sp.]